MTRNLKALGLALVALFAMGVLTASVASAANDQFTTTKTTAWATGTSHDNIFKITTSPNANEFKCTTSQFTATIENKKTEATVLASYTGKTNATPHTSVECNATIGSVKVDMNDCHYKLTGFTDKEHPALSKKFDAKIWITCPAGKEIVITGPLGCTVKVHEQTPTEGGVVYRNLPLHAGKPAVEVEATVTGITYTSDCIGIPAEANNADYNGTVVVTGFEDDSIQNPDPKELTKPVEGLQIPIEVTSDP